MTSMNNIRIFIMKICYICCAIAMSYIAISCLSENKIIDRSSPVLIVNLDSTKVSEFRYSDIFKSVTAIELDEKDALLGGIDKMQIYKSQLFVLDSRSTKGVYIFDRKGTFMRKIGNIGLAPDEYVSCDDFTINIDDNELYIFDSLQNKITIALLFVIMNYACKTAMTGIALAWGEQTLPRELINYRIVMDPWSQMMACILFVLSLWGTICIRELRLNKQNLLYAVISYLFPLTVMISVIIISHKNIGFGSAAGIQVFYIYTSVLLFSASISLFYLLEKNILLDMSGEKSSVMEELLSLQRRHYERLDISQRELQSLRHDIKNHISCLYALLDSGHAKEAKEYIKELYTCNKGLQGIIYSGNIVIDSILSNGLANLENRGINLKCSIIIPPSLNIADVDLCILFGNLIDNAVEACERIVEPGRKKFIVLNVNIKKDYLFIDIANSFTGEVKKQNNIYRTVKIDERYCGIGLFNIRKIVEKYNGEFSVSHSDNVFSVSVMLSLLWGKK